MGCVKTSASSARRGCERVTNTPVAERVNGAPQDVGQHAATEQLLRLDNPGGVQGGWGWGGGDPEVPPLRRRVAGLLLRNFLPRPKHTTEPFCPETRSLFHYRQSHLHRGPAGATGGMSVATTQRWEATTLLYLRISFSDICFFFF